MKSKFVLFLASFLMCVTAFAQWTEPATPANQKMVVGQEYYLFNVEARGFFVGANDYGTRASVSQSLGHKVVIENGTASGSYYITNFVLSGWMANQWGYLFIEPNNINSIYVDNTKEGKTNNQFTVEEQTDGTYRFGLSAENETWKSSDYAGAYLGINTTKKNDTRIYLCDPENPGDYTMEQCQIKWIFTTEDAYKTYVAAVQQYEAAIALGAVIDEAKAAGVDYSAAEAVFNNHEASVEQLNAARTTLAQAVKEAGFANASVAKPYTVKIFDFEDKDASAWKSTVSSQNKGADNGNNAADYSATGIHYENWNPSNFAVGGKISTVAAEMPAGVYHVSALAFSSSGNGVSLFAGNASTPVTANKIDINTPVDVYTYITTKQDLEYGLQVEANKMNWVGIDNVKLEYLGSSAEAYQIIADNVLKNAPEYDDETLCEAALYDAYAKAKAELESISDPTKIADAINAFQKAVDAIAPSVEAYKAYQEAADKADEWLQECTEETNEINYLADYLAGDDEPAADAYNGNGAYVYILINRTLNTEQIAAEAEYLEQLVGAAKGSIVIVNPDCTDVIINPHFTTDEGWNKGLCTFNAGPDDGKVAEGYNIAFDVNQTVQNLPNGLYELRLHGFVRNAGYDKEEYSSEESAQHAFVYMNGFEKKLPAVESQAYDEVAEDVLNEYVYREGVGYVPNTVTSASKAFYYDDRYAISVYALVTDNTLKIGIRNDVRYEESWVCWSGVELFYRGKNAEVLAQVIESQTPIANEMLNNYCGQAEIDALSKAIEAAKNADEDDIYDTFVDMKIAMDAVEKGTSLYAELNTALASLKDAIANNTKADATTVAMAQGVYDDAKAAYDSKSYDNEEAEAAVAQVSSATVSVKMGKINASEDNPVNFTSAIVNPTFDPARGSKDTGTIEGWTTTAMNGYKQYSCSYNRAAFELNQTLSGLPKGKYKVTVHTYYRAGYWNEEEAYIANGQDTHLTTLYAQTSADKFTTPVMNLTEGAIPAEDKPADCGNTYTLSNGLIAPDGTSPTVSFFNAGYYLNELRFEVPEDGQVTIGLSKKEILPNDYEVVGAWELWYMGEGDSAVKDTIDVTDYIINNNFDPARGSKDTGTIEGWTTTAMNGYKQYSCSYNRAAFELNQTIKGLEPGRYMVTVHTYYRAGYWNEEEAYIANGEETHLTTLYAQTSADKFTTPVMNLSEGAIPAEDKPADCGNTYTLSNGLIAPDGTSPTVSFFNAGYYLNKLDFVVPEDGTVTIGLSKKEIFPNDYEVVGEWRLYRLPDAAEITEEDFTDYIINPTFDPSRGSKDTGTIEGWTTTAMNGYKQYSCSYNRAAFELNQTIKGLPEGTYKVTVHTYYRAGYYNEEEALIANGEETHLTTLYAQTATDKYSTPVMNLSEGAIPAENKPADCGNCYTLSNGLIAPDGTSPTVSFFNAGYYLNELCFYVGSEGTVTIGLSKKEIIANDYEVVGAWNLYYYGPGNNVDEVATDIQSVELAPSSLESAVPVAYYSLSGTQLSKPQKGVNIVKMSNNQVLKIMIK